MSFYSLACRGPTPNIFLGVGRRFRVANLYSRMRAYHRRQADWTARERADVYSIHGRIHYVEGGA